MSTLEEYTAALHQFCTDLSRTIDQAAADSDLEKIGYVQDVIRETIANLSLADFECQRILDRG